MCKASCLVGYCNVLQYVNNNKINLYLKIYITYNNMNYTPVDSAYDVQHIAKSTYTKNIRYLPQCIFCPAIDSVALMNDGGSFRRCLKCNKHFRAKIANNTPVSNYSYATQHLK